MDILPFRDRQQAGRQLAHALESYAGREDLTVLALPRGGVPVAAEVARALGTSLDVVVVRKIGAPGQPELAVGALAIVGGTIDMYRNEQMMSRVGGGEAFDDIAARELVELRRRESLYRAGRDPISLNGRTVLLVDDGLATGATMRVAVAAVRRLAPQRVVVAVPVGSDSACEDLRKFADDVVCLAVPEPFDAVGAWYQEFAQTTDDEVRQALDRVNTTTAPEPTREELT